MYESGRPPRPPPSSSKPSVERLPTRALTHSHPHAPTPSTSYSQPMGSISRQRANTLGATPTSKGPLGTSTRGVKEGTPRGRKRIVSCDVVLDGMRNGEDKRPALPKVTVDFISSIGSAFQRTPSTLSFQRPPRSTTPGPPSPTKPLGSDPASVQKRISRIRDSLTELWQSEEKYLKKVTSLMRDYAEPLRQYAERPATAVIRMQDAQRLFSNIQDLVPIARAFERDLRDLVQDMEGRPGAVPSFFGELILNHVLRMEPYKTYLANVSLGKATFKMLSKTNSLFTAFIERQQVSSREVTQSTGGLEEFLAEPFQRPPRYKLFVDQLLKCLDETDRNVEYLEEAAKLLTDICSMELDDGTQTLATLWALKETIEDFPWSLNGLDRKLISCLDANEIVDGGSGGTTVLRTTLFLFRDKFMLVKRPSSDKGGRQLAGLDNLDQLVFLYSNADTASSHSSLPGSAKKLKKGVMGFRGSVEILELHAVDFGGVEFGLVFEHPPTLASERWSGRPARRFVVASTYPTDIQQAEKEAFLTQIAETQALFKAQQSFSLARRSEPIWDRDELDSTVVYWNLCERPRWESDDRGLRGRLVLHVDAGGSAPFLRFPGEGGNPRVIVRLDLLGNDFCRLTVISRNGATPEPEVIRVERVVPAVEAIATSHALYDFPTSRPTTPGGSVRSRPRSALLNAIDVFSGGSGLRRGQSITSKSSTMTSGSSYSRGTPGTLSPQPTRKLHKASSNWFGSVSHENLRGGEMYSAETDDEETDGVEILRSSYRSGSVTPASPSYEKPKSRRRSTSLPPPPQPRFLTASQLAHPQPSRIPVASNSVLALSDQNEDGPTMASTEVRRRPMGPRAPGSAPATCHPSTSGDITPPGPPPLEALEKYQTPTPPAKDHSPTPTTRLSLSPPATKRPLEDVSARSPPPKKSAAQALGLGQPKGPPSPTGIRSGRILSGSHGRVLSGGKTSVASLALGRRGKRVASNSSTIRGISPPWTSDTVSPSAHLPSLPPPSPMDGIENGQLPHVGSNESEGHNERLDSLKRRVTTFRDRLARALAEKENADTFARVGALSRSPQNRNLKARGEALSSVLSPKSDRSGGKNDLSSLVRWADELASFVEETSIELSSAESETSLSQVGYDMLQEERDLIGQQVVDLTATLEKAHKRNEELETRLSALEAQYATLRQIYGTMTVDATETYEDYAEELRRVASALSASPSKKVLADELATALSDKRRAQVELANLQNAHTLEMEEKARWGLLLREHRLLPEE